MTKRMKIVIDTLVSRGFEVTESHVKTEQTDASIILNDGTDIQFVSPSKYMLYTSKGQVIDELTLDQVLEQLSKQKHHYDTDAGQYGEQDGE
jgi:hypothetical protein